MNEPNSPESDDCVVHDHPVPAEEMWRYSPDRDPDEEQGIIDYMRGQAGDEVVLHVEKVRTEYVLGDQYEMWDVTTDKDGWWVITNLTNLYLKRHFPSLDYTLSFHIGLMARLKTRDAAPDPDMAPFAEVGRRDEQIMERWERAVEPEDFQAVGMLLRENLLALMRALRERVELGPHVTRPKGADFKEWSVVILDQLCPGERNKELRSFMKALAEKTWSLVGWLTHDRNASRGSSLIAAQSCSTLNGHFTQLLFSERLEGADSCPHCRSRNVRSHYDRELGDGGYYKTCGNCAWTDHPWRPRSHTQQQLRNSDDGSAQLQQDTRAEGLVHLWDRRAYHGGRPPRCDRGVSGQH